MHSWKRCKKMPLHENKIKIVNFYNRNAVKSFYCDALKAERACKLESEHSVTHESRTKASTACFNLEVRNYWSQCTHKDDSSPDAKNLF